jgi:hypothetical protein
MDILFLAFSPYILLQHNSLKILSLSSIMVFLQFVAEIESSPVACLVAEATNAVCGADFTVWLSSVEGSSILYVLLEIQN